MLLSVQTVVKLGLPKGMYLRPSDFREELAREHAGKTVDDVFFHREPGTGFPQKGRAPIRVIGGSSWVGVLAEPGFGPELLHHLPYLLSVARSKVGLLTVQIDETEVGVTPMSETYCDYVVRNMMVRRRTLEKNPVEANLARQFRGTENSPEYLAQYLRNAVIEELRPAFLARNQEVEDYLDLAVEITDQFPLTCAYSGGTADAPRQQVMDRVHAKICMNAKLSGIWQVGALRSRGYGRIIRNLPVGAHATMRAA